MEVGGVDAELANTLVLLLDSFPGQHSELDRLVEADIDPDRGKGAVVLLLVEQLHLELEEVVQVLVFEVNVELVHAFEASYSAYAATGWSDRALDHILAFHAPGHRVQGHAGFECGTLLP